MWLKFLLLLVVSHSAFASQAFWGKKVSVGNGYARTFASLDKAGRLKEMGIVISHKALDGLGHMDKSYELPLPQKVSIPPYKLVTLDWNPHGHEPENVYTLPHFDMHFYFITKSQRDQISCMGDDAAVCTKEIPSKYLVSNYAPTPAGVPKMGWHWVDLLSGEFNGEKFTKTYIYGYYNAKPIFLEPMVTWEYLASKTNGPQNLRLPKSFPQSGYYPKKFKVTYDSHKKLHKIVLMHFKRF